MPFDNRIVGEAQVAPDQLLANPYNFRVHSTMQQAAITHVLARIGWVQRILVNVRTSHVIDGHARIAIALRHQEATVPVIYIDVSEEDEKLLLSVLDPLSAMAGTDTEQLGMLLHEIQTQEENAIQAMLAGFATHHGLTPAAPSATPAPPSRQRQCPACGHTW